MNYKAPFPNERMILCLAGFLCILLLPLPSALAQSEPVQDQETPEPPSLMDWLLEKDQVNLFLESDFEKLKEERRKQEYQPAIVSIPDVGSTFEWEVEIRPRGKFRCMMCEIPPVKLKFSKKNLKNAGYPKWNEFKLVLPCQPGEKYEQWVIKEYLVYHLYNLLTEESYRVKWINLNLNCTSTGEKTVMPAFIIEHGEEAAGRLNGEELDSMGINPSNFAPEAYMRFQLFQYMIGNTDWIPPVQHNLDLIQLEDGRLIPLPFDFDFSGFVHTDYAVPNTRTNLADVRKRFFMANEVDETLLRSTIEQFEAKKSAILSVVNDCELLEKRERRQLGKYLESFFEVITDPDRVREEFLDREPFQPNVY